MSDYTTVDGWMTLHGIHAIPAPMGSKYIPGSRSPLLAHGTLVTSGSFNTDLTTADAWALDRRVVNAYGSGVVPEAVLRIHGVEIVFYDDTFREADPSDKDGVIKEAYLRAKVGSETTEIPLFGSLGEVWGPTVELQATGANETLCPVRSDGPHWLDQPLEVTLDEDELDIRFDTAPAAAYPMFVRFWGAMFPKSAPRSRTLYQGRCGSRGSAPGQYLESLEGSRQIGGIATRYGMGGKFR